MFKDTFGDLDCTIFSTLFTFFLLHHYSGTYSRKYTVNCFNPEPCRWIAVGGPYRALCTRLTQNVFEDLGVFSLYNLRLGTVEKKGKEVFLRIVLYTIEAQEGPFAACCEYTL